MKNKWSLLAFSFLLIHKFVEGQNCLPEDSSSEILETIILPEKYNSNQPPNTDGPTEVRVQISPIAIGEISLDKMRFEVDLYIELSWEDCRLNITSPTKKSVQIGDDLAKKIWVPLVEFRNCIGCASLTYQPKKHTVKLKEKQLHFGLRQGLQLSCHFRLDSYPMDIQICHVEIKSVLNNVKVILVQNSSMTHLENQEALLQFDIVQVLPGLCQEVTSSKKYSCVDYKIKLRRLVSFYVMLTYIPSALIVILSWMSFWLDAQNTAPRVAIGLMSLLTLTTQFASIQKDLPPVSYMKAIDVWMFVCIFFVFASLLELALANMNQRNNQSDNKSCCCEIFSRTAFFQKVNDTTEDSKAETPTQVAEIASKGNPIDNISKKVFPPLFLIFNVIYWVYYQTASYTEQV